MIENKLAIGVNAPQKSKRLVSAKASVFHRLTFTAVELWTVESNSIPMILTRSKNSAAPGNPVGNIEKSRCTGSSYDPLALTEWFCGAGLH